MIVLAEEGIPTRGIRRVDSINPESTVIHLPFTHILEILGGCGRTVTMQAIDSVIVHHNNRYRQLVVEQLELREADGTGAVKYLEWMPPSRGNSGRFLTRDITVKVDLRPYRPYKPK